MTDTFQYQSDTLIAPPRKSRAITPHDSTEQSPYPRAIYVGTGGNIVARLIDDTADVTWTNVPAGSIIPGRFKLIKSTSTTASDIVGIL